MGAGPSVEARGKLGALETPLSLPFSCSGSFNNSQVGDQEKRAPRGVNLGGYSCLPS